MQVTQESRFTPLPPEVQIIPLTQGLIAWVSVEDYEWLCQYNWHARKDGNTFYAVTRRSYSDPQYSTAFIMMHRLIGERMGVLTETTPEMDHIDGNGLNNVRNNLRGATRSQNAANRPAKGWTIDNSQQRRKRYKVSVGGKHVGRFETEEEAVAAYLKKKMEIYGEYTRNS